MSIHGFLGARSVVFRASLLNSCIFQTQSCTHPVASTHSGMLLDERLDLSWPSIPINFAITERCIPVKEINCEATICNV